MTNEQVSQLIESFRNDKSSILVDDLIEQVVAVPEDSQESLWAVNILESASVIKERCGIEKAIVLLSEAYKEWPITYPSSYLHKTSILKQLCMLQIEAQRHSDAHATMNRYIYNALKQVSATSNVKKMRYFSFRCFSDYALADIKKEQISLAHPREFNDPLDTILVWWLNDSIQNGSPGLQLEFKLLMKKAVEHIKIRCMIGSKYTNEAGEVKERTIEELSILMWAHYAKSHTGFCVEYELDKTKLCMSYRPEEDKADLIQPIKYVSNINIDDDPSMEMALFHKSDFWEYENEMRLCSFDSLNCDEYPALSCPGSIKAIYLGVKCSDKNRRDMERVVADKDIPLYQMCVDPQNLTRLKKIRIG